MMFWSLADAQTKKTITFYMENVIMGEKTITFYDVLVFSRCSDQENHYFLFGNTYFGWKYVMFYVVCVKKNGLQQIWKLGNHL